MVEAVMVRIGIVRHRRTKGAETDRPNIEPHRPTLYSTQGFSQVQIILVKNIKIKYIMKLPAAERAGYLIFLVTL